MLHTYKWHPFRPWIVELFLLLKNLFMKNLFKSLWQKIISTLIILPVSLAAFASGSVGDKTTTSLSSLTGFEITVSVATVLFLFIVLGSKTSRKPHNKSSVY
jgi:hypothetical protein